ncbi:hypothetical protein TNCT_694461 [Trichonephila clavata]|uniref:Uncharacterized protein n=1 Tax=Trichonephila clavata TaxID=2740835 RepID=A0A8X6KBT4_TRICU|nr:hypothetical protein TNCT_694461 [Trichonephila clavata]
MTLKRKAAIFSILHHSALSYDKFLTCLDPVDLTASVRSADVVELLLLQDAVAVAGATTASAADKRVKIAAVEIANVAERQNAEI